MSPGFLSRRAGTLGGLPSGLGFLTAWQPGSKGLPQRARSSCLTFGAERSHSITPHVLLTCRDPPRSTEASPIQEGPVGHPTGTVRPCTGLGGARPTHPAVSLCLCLSESLCVSLYLSMCLSRSLYL